MIAPAERFGPTPGGSTPPPLRRDPATARFRMAVQTMIAQRRSMLESGRERLTRALIVASASLVAVFLLLVVLAPLHKRMQLRVEVPETTRTFELEMLEPVPPAERLSHDDLENLNAPEVVNRIEPEDAIAPPPRRVEADKPIDPAEAKIGRERASEATASLNQAAEALDRALGDLSSSLRSSTDASEVGRSGRQRRVRSGRSDSQVGTVGDGPAGSGASTDLQGSAVEGRLVGIGTLSQPRAAESAPSSDRGRRSGSGPGVYRTNASLLAVIQRYAAGIQYCYETELKRDPGLTGKLVVAMTVAASGTVTEASVVQNTVRSERLTTCALSQIRDWKFPAIPEGVTTFQAPFVFTPPN